jgi:hypothetical protein
LTSKPLDSLKSASRETKAKNISHKHKKQQLISLPIFIAVPALHRKNALAQVSKSSLFSPNIQLRYDWKYMPASNFDW